MNEKSLEFVTTECPNGHRVRGDAGWLDHEVKCPHCQAEFLFTHPESHPESVVAVRPPTPGGQPGGGPQQSRDRVSETGVMRILGDYVPPGFAERQTRRCGQCGTTYPAGVSVCDRCNCELLSTEESNAEDRSTNAMPGSNTTTKEDAEPIDFHEVHKVAFEDVAVRRVIRPRRDIAFLDINDSLEEMKKQVRETMHSRYPVCDHSLDTILGVVHIKDLLVAEEDDIDIRAILESPDEIPDTTPVSKVLQHFHNDGVPMAFVLDEFENIIGIVTLKDVLSKLAQRPSSAD